MAKTITRRQTVGFARAIVGGAVAEKVLPIVDLLPFVYTFPGKPLMHNISQK